MRRVDLELLVQRAVENRRAGGPAEDDRIEFKSDWPKPEKARQFAGAANALRGEPLVYVIGVDNAGNVQAVTDREPSDWLAQMAGAFDGSPPRLALHINVSVGDEKGDVVTALMFETDEFPYVLNIPGSDRREVPLRVATGTVSANRRQLMRILAPTVSAPPTEISELHVDAHVAGYAGANLPEAPHLNERTELTLHVRGRVFIEYTGTHAVSIPFRSMSAALTFGEMQFPLDLRVHELRAPNSGPGNGPSPEPIPPRFGVHAKNRVVVATGPGEFSFDSWTHASTNDANHTPESIHELAELLAQVATGTFEFRFRFVGSEAVEVLTVETQRTSPAAELKADLKPNDMSSLGAWDMVDPYTK